MLGFAQTSGCLTPTKVEDRRERVTEMNELELLEKEKQVLEKDFNIYNGKLNNEGYLSKAKEEVIAKDREKLADIVARLEKVNESIKRFKGL